MKYTDKEVIKVLNNANFPKGLTTKQSLIVFWWCVFNKKMMNKFIHAIECGMSLMFAFYYTYQIKKFNE